MKTILKEKNIAIPFFMILLVKVILAGLFSSDYQNKMFEPFVFDFFKGLGTGSFNPWQIYYETGKVIHFPYPIFMLLLSSIGGAGVMQFEKLPLFIHNIIFKLPLFLADILLMFFLVKMFPNRVRRCLWCYFASPIIIYACYMHGQLDIIPMSLAFISLYFLTGVNDKKKFFTSALLMGLAILTKLHILAILPLVLVYVHRIYGYKRFSQYTMVVLLTSLIGILPFGEMVLQAGFYSTRNSRHFCLFIFPMVVLIYICR